MRVSRIALASLVASLNVANACARAPQPDDLDAFIHAQMAQRRIPGLSLAVVDHGRVAVARAYGVADESTRTPVTSTTLFQAGSISKPVSALAALHLVEAGKLSLDEDVNAKLTSWKVPDNRFTAAEQVTLRRLLSHNAGVTVHGFPGYDRAGPIATLVQVLDGAPPANTPPIRVDTTPGAIWRYSGGGFTIMQQLLIDVTGTPFPQFLQQTVLGPIGMTASSFAQPPTEERAARNATGYYADRTPVHEHWHVYPEMAAAGLWTTPTDLARFAIEIQETMAGGGHGVISPAMARQYLTEQIGGSGLGIGVADSGNALRFSHGGRDEGFDALLYAYAETGQGVAIMINANDNSGFMNRVLAHVARAYGWQGAQWAAAPAGTTGVALPATLLADHAGYYEAAENQMITFVPDSNGLGLATLADGLPDETFLALDSTRFGSSERSVRLTFERAQGRVVAVAWQPANGSPRRMPRIAPLPSAVTPVPDPDSALTGRIRAAVSALIRGGPTLASAPDVTPGARADFGAGAGNGDMGAPTYLGETDVTGRGIHRHGSDVARVRYYRTTFRGGVRYLFVHLTAPGVVTDIDLVGR